MNIESPLPASLSDPQEAAESLPSLAPQIEMLKALAVRPRQATQPSEDMLNRIRRTRFNSMRHTRAVQERVQDQRVFWQQLIEHQNNIYARFTDLLH